MNSQNDTLIELISQAATQVAEAMQALDQIEARLEEMQEEIKKGDYMEGAIDRILIGTPICTEKMYCWDEWLEAVKKIKMPDKNTTANLLIVDTSNSELIKTAAMKEGILYQTTAPKISRPMDKVVEARNIILAYAIDNKYTHILFLDSDVIVPPETVSRLLSDKMDIVAGFYPIPNFYGMPVPCAKFQHEEGQYVDFPSEKIDGELHVVDLVGLGCTLLTLRRSLAAVKFRCVRDQYGSIKKSEDMCYCSDLQEQGFRIYFDSGLICKHKTIGSHWTEEA